MITNGYTLKFACRPPHFSSVLVSEVSDEDELVLRAEIHSFLAKTGHRIGAARAQGKYPVRSLFSIPHEGRWSLPHFGSETAESRGVRAPFQNDYREANPPAYSTCEMVCVGGFKRCIFSYPDSFVSGCARKPHHLQCLEIYMLAVARAPLTRHQFVSCVRMWTGPVRGCSKDLPLSKQCLPNWIVDTIVLVFASKNETCPIGFLCSLY